MPNDTFVEIPLEEQARMRAELRRARYGYLLALHLLLGCGFHTAPLLCRQSDCLAQRA